MMRTVITHFHNEEFLLPYWLRHHVEMFDHGILINHHSTDDSADIARDLAPHWSLVQSETEDFDAIDCDFEVMLHERTVPGWKIALTTTEFLCCPKLSHAERLAENKSARALCFNAAIMVEPPSLKLPPVVDSAPLVAQRHHGYLERDHPTLLGKIPYHNRLYHSFPHGSYHPGRHLSNRPAAHMDRLGMLLWFGFSPWEERFLARKRQIALRVPDADRVVGRGRQHLYSDDEREAIRARLAAHAFDLRNLPLFHEATGADLVPVGAGVAQQAYE